MKMLLSFQYLLDEVGHFHLRPVLGHVRLHLRVRIINDGQEHVLHKQRDSLTRVQVVLSARHTNAFLTMRIKKMKRTKVIK